MNKNIRHGLVGISLLLAACTHNASKNDGTELADPSAFRDVSVEFKKLEDRYYRSGNFVAGKALSRVGAGAHSSAVRALLGNPLDHSSNAWWFYNINLPLGQGDDYLVCQYRIALNGEGVVTGAEWRRPQCRDIYNAMQTPDVEELTLSSDVLFEFDSARLTARGERELDLVASVVRDKLDLDRIQVVGHTDRLGAAAYNEKLSRQRAEAVKRYLTSQAVPAQAIATEGRGSREPVVDCPGTRVTESLKACLQPNRRVQIFIHGKGNAEEVKL